MAKGKDPAFLFYPGDWLGGTMGMTFEEKGAYFELLVLQWHSGRIASDAAIRLVGETLWYKLMHKFEADGGGFFNKRLESEKIKRRKHAEKQSDNAKKRWNQSQSGGIANAMPLENENINENINLFKDGVVGEGGWSKKPGKEMIEMDLDEVKAGAVKQLFKISKNHHLTNEQLKTLWYVFKAQNFTGQKFYASPNDVYSHFINWSKTQNINGKDASNFKQTNGNNYKTVGQEVFADRFKRKFTDLNGE